nr:MAG TPA: hypothetical protein [Caudoviricetes sp.]
MIVYVVALTPVIVNGARASGARVRRCDEACLVPLQQAGGGGISYIAEGRRAYNPPTRLAKIKIVQVFTLPTRLLKFGLHQVI